MNNTIVEPKQYTLEDAEERRRIVTEELYQFREIAHSLDLTGNRKYYARGTISDEQWRLYKDNSKEILKREKELQHLNNFIKSNRRRKEDEVNILKDLLTETLSKQDSLKILVEWDRRHNGLHPFKVRIDKNDNSDCIEKIKALKEISTGALDALAKARSAITAYVRKNEPEINKANYLMSVSEINKSCPAYSEIETLKNKVNRI